MKVYNVIHLYDVESEFGDAVECSEIVATFESEKDADAYIEKYSNPHIYATPYSNLWEGKLIKQEREIISHNDFDINNNYGFNSNKYLELEKDF